MNSLPANAVKNDPIPAWAWVFAFALVLIELIAAPFAAATLDTARDLHWAHQIASAQDFPLLGPRIADSFHLTSLWFYLLAPPLLLFGSLNAVSVWVGLLAALQYPLALLLGTRLVNWRLGCLFVATLALPSLASYTLITWTHISVVGTAVVLFGLALERDWRQPDKRSALWLGLSVLIMLQAHPTLLALCWPIVWLWWRGGDRLRRGLLIAVPAALGLWPLWLALVRNAFDGVSHSPALPISFAPLLETPGLIWRSLVYGSDAVIHLVANDNNALIGSMRGVMLVVVLAAALGLYRLFLSSADRTTPQIQRQRQLARFALACIVLYGLLVSWMRPFTWWYMMLGIVPPAALLQALGLYRLPRWPSAFFPGMALFYLLGFGISSLIWTGSQGISRHFPVGFLDMKKPAPQQDVDDSPWMPLYAQDRLARFVCSDTHTVTLHGTVAFVLDPTGRLLHALHCPQSPEWRILGQREPQAESAHWLGIRSAALASQPIQSERTFAGMALVRIDRVLFPQNGLPIGDAGSEKLRGWAGDTIQTHRLSVELAADQRVAIGNAFFWQARHQWLKIEADGRPVQLLANDQVTQVYACTDCTAGSTVEWIFEFNAPVGYPPDIVAF